MITSATLSTFTGLANEELSVVMIWALGSSEAQVLCSWRNLAGMLTLKLNYVLLYFCRLSDWSQCYFQTMVFV